ncbi:hypothetical protein [Subtercola boreus]|nr:hypothetical protein [Subtercola boreus]TQL54604.1 hypothetical protein FB464_2145 [Subtercola boreus]
MTQTEILRATDPHAGLKRALTVGGLSLLTAATTVLVVIASVR